MTPRPVTPASVADLEREAVVARLVDRALSFLGVRPRSEAELRRYLQRYEATPEQADAVLVELQRLELVDDAAFARYWREARDQVAPRGERLLRAELRAKGVGADEVAAVLPEPEEEAALARQAAERPLRTARALPWPEFRAKLLGYLQRRGFSYETASRTARDLWEELTTERPDAEDEGETMA